MKKYSLEINWNRLIKIFSFFIFFIAIYKSYVYRFVCDDAFISFRYAKNFLNGYGLVFNQGETIEGYTNFLWTLLLSLGMKFNLDPIPLSMYLGISFFIFSLFALLTASNIVSILLNQKRKILIPIAFLCFAIQSHAQIFATSGLEVSMFGFLILIGFLLILFGTEKYHFFFGNFVLILATMTRPDGALFYLFGNIFILFFRTYTKNFRVQLLRCLFYQIPFLFLYLPYFFWKWSYYGWIFPNTFYAKSADGIYLSQGLKYISMYFLAYYSLLGIFVLGILEFIGFRKIKIFYSKLFNTETQQRFRSRKEYQRNHRKIKDKVFLVQKKIPKLISLSTEAFLILMVPSILYILFLFKIGGDFMFARLLIPITPLILFYGEIVLYELSSMSRNIISIFLFLGFVFFYNPYQNTQIPVIDEISNESDIYKLKSVYELKLELLSISKIFQDEEISFAFGGSQAMIVYYLNPKLAIESTTGLTDEWIAHQSLIERGKVGHEKKAPQAYLWKRNVHINLFPDAETPITTYNSFSIKALPGVFRILNYDSASFENLEKSGKFTFVNFEKFLDHYITGMNGKSKKKVRSDYEEFKKYYFLKNEDFIREGKFKKYLSAN